ncbi:hypothetical protein GCM10010129_66800 [Streptomyces fumigatiscleroticus]|nr:hypothetical protein GCM10010129_66800 [Streptomyces fumigatiscleroticus]
MARRPLPRILSTGGAQLARSRELARTAADSATDVLQPLITITRGLGRLAAAGRRRWSDTPKDKRGGLLFLVASVVLVVALAPYGPLLAVVTLMAAAAWRGRDRIPPAADGPGEPQTERLKSLYEALVPYFSTTEDPAPLYAHGGTWEAVFPAYEFDDTGRFSHLVIRYPAYFPDGENEARARVEHLLTAKSGRDREYHFGWDEEGNQLTVTALAPLPTGVTAQRFVTAPGETVLGFTDPTLVRRTLPLACDEQQHDVPPVVWRTGIRSTEPHLLVLGQPGSGTSTLLRSVVLQALRHGDVLIVDGGGTGEYACLTGRDGVLAVECGLTGALTSLEWAAHETERRLVAANRARQEGRPPPDDTKRPLWIVLDRPSAFAHLATADDRKDPQSLLVVPLRHGRAANVTVAVADQLDCVDVLADAVRQHTRARVVLGPATPDQLRAALGAPPHTTPVAHVPPGRGYARLGTGAVHRLQVPATPDPYDDATSAAHRKAVLDLLPPRTTPADGETVPDPVERKTATRKTVPALDQPEPAPATADPALDEGERTTAKPVPTLDAPQATPSEAVTSLDGPERTPAKPVPTLDRPEATPAKAVLGPDQPEPAPTSAVLILDGPERTPAKPVPTLDAPQATPSEADTSLDAPERTPAKPVPTLDRPEATPAKAVLGPDQPEPAPTSAVLILDGPERTPARPVPTLDAPQATPSEAVPTLDAPQATPSEAVPSLDGPERTPAKPVPTLDAPQATPSEADTTPDRPEATPAEAVAVLDASEPASSRDDVPVLDEPETAPAEPVPTLTKP